MSIERLAAPGRFIGLSLADIASRRALKPQAVSALFAPVAMLAGAVGLTCVWNALPHQTPNWSNLAAEQQPLSRPARPETGAVAQAAMRQSTAISSLLIDLGAIQVTPPAPAALVGGPSASLQRLRDAESDMIAAADRGARTQIDDMGRTYRAAGLNPNPYMTARMDRAGISPLELRNAHVLAARLDIDMGLARQLQRTARDLLAVRSMSAVQADMPLAVPVDDPHQSSPFGVRIDPFRGEASFHPGVDFAGQYGQAIHVTAPGVVSFVGQRSGYGNCVEVDHGYGFKTRYGHLSGFAVRVGQAVNTGDTIARMGSTGRSTGVHLHYEVWADGKLQNPSRFLKAGELQAAAAPAPILRARG